MLSHASFRRRKHGLEQLESRELLATDLLSAITPPSSTLSSSPENLVHGRQTFFDAKTSSSSAERQIFRSDGTLEGTVQLMPGEIEDSQSIGGQVFFLSGRSLYTQSDTEVELLASLPADNPSDEAGRLDKLDFRTIIWIQPQVGQSIGAPISRYMVIDKAGIRPLELPFTNSNSQWLGAAGGRAWFLEPDPSGLGVGQLWSTDGNDRRVHFHFGGFTDVGQTISSGSSLYFFNTQREISEPSETVDAGIWELTVNGNTPTLRMISSAANTSNQLVDGENLYFVMHTAEAGRELYQRVDGRIQLVDVPRFRRICISGR